MAQRWKAIAGALLAAGIVNFVGVLFLLNPVAEKDSAGTPLVSPAIGFIVYVALSVALFDWAARQMNSAYKAAFIVAASQFVLVNVDFVLSGKRGLLTAAASTLLIVITWASVAYVYTYIAKKTGRNTGAT